MNTPHACCDPGPTTCCAPAPAPAARCCAGSDSCATSPATPAAAALPAAADTGTDADTLHLHIPDMDCPSEEAQIRRALEGVAGVGVLRFDLSARTLSIAAATARWPAIEQAIADSGLRTHRLAHSQAAATARRLQQRAMWRLGGALALALGAELIDFFAPAGRVWQVTSMALAALAIALAGLGVYRKGLTALRRGQLGINALMTVAVSGAFLIGEWAEAGMVMTLYALAELIEARAVDRARNAIKSLLELAPATAEVRQADGSWASQLAGAVAVGAIVRVKPGERLALDGRVVAGRSAIDQAPVTGESVPVDKEAGDPVFAGTINQQGALEFEVTAPASDTVLARITHAVEEAQGTRAPTQRLVDRFAAIYTPAVFALALAVALLGPWLGGWTWLEALYQALVMLVIACPCALVISTPVTVVSGLAAAARRGILIKGGVYLEEARRLTRIALDKTGTLTVGRPCLVAFEALRPGTDAACVERLAAALAARSDHPVSHAIAQGLADAQDVASATLPAVSDFAAVPGRGIQGHIDGRLWVLGSPRWMEERGQCSVELAARLDAHAQRGHSLSLLADDAGVLGLFAVADTLRPDAATAVQELRALDIEPVMLTGDNAATAQAIATAAGIDTVRAGLLPQQKLDAVRALNAQSGNTAGMAGDGINDAPALAAAHIGFAMGKVGTHTATEAADVVIMNDDLRRVAETVRLSRRTHTVLWQNITLALGIKLVFLLLALSGHATMWMAVFADMGAALLVVFNGLRLLRPRHATAVG